MQCTRYMSYALGGSFIGLSLLRNVALAVVGQPLWKGEKVAAHIFKLSEWTGWSHFHIWLAACYIRGCHSFEQSPYHLIGRIQDWTRDAFALSKENKFFNTATLFGLIWLGGTTLYSFRASLAHFLAEQIKFIQLSLKARNKVDRVDRSFVQCSGNNNLSLNRLYLRDETPERPLILGDQSLPFSHSGPLIGPRLKKRSRSNSLLSKRQNPRVQRLQLVKGGLSHHSNVSSEFSRWSNLSTVTKLTRIDKPSESVPPGSPSPLDDIAPDLSLEDRDSSESAKKGPPLPPRLQKKDFSNSSFVMIDLNPRL